MAKRVTTYSYKWVGDVSSLVKGAKLTRQEMAAVRRSVKEQMSPLDELKQRVQLLGAAYWKGAKVQKEYQTAIAAYRAEKQRLLAVEKQQEESLRRQNSLMARSRALYAGFKGRAAGFLGGGGAASMMGLMGPAAGMLSTYGAYRGVANAVRSSEEFAQGMASSTAIMKGVNADVRKDMELTAHTVAYQTKYSAKEGADAYYYLASAGLNAKQSIASLPIVATFAQAGMFDLALATDLLTDAQSALGLTVKDSVVNMRNMTRVGDVLVKANTLANASVQQFSESLTNKAGAALRMVGKDVEEGVAVLAAFADQGLKGSDAGTAFNIVLRDLTTKAYENKGAFERLGVQVYDYNGEVRNMADIIRDLERAMAGKSDVERKATLLQLGLTDKSVAFTAALIGNSEKIRAYEAELRKASGTMKDVAEKQLPELTRQVNQLKAAWDLFKIEFGKPIASGLAGAAKDAGLLANTLATILDMQFAMGLGDKAKAAQEKRFSLWGEEQELKAKWQIKGAFGMSDAMKEQKAKEFADLYRRKAENAQERIDVHETYEGDTPGSRYLAQLQQMRMGTPTVGNRRQTSPQGPRPRGPAGIAGAMRESNVDAQKTYADTTASLKEQIRTFNMTAAAQEEYRLRQEGLTEQEVRYSMALWRRLEAMKAAKDEQEKAKDLAKQQRDKAERQAKSERDEMVRRARAAADSVRTEQEKFRDNMRRISRWWKEGMISAEEYRRLRKKALEESGSAGGKSGRYEYKGVEALQVGTQESALAYLATMKSAAEIKAAQNGRPPQSSPQQQALVQARQTNTHLARLVQLGEADSSKPVDDVS